MVNNDLSGADGTANCQMRRATVDDLVDLRRLWQQMSWPVPALEKRLGDFQVVETPAGQLLGAIGIQIEAQHGRLHAEVFQNGQLAEQLRPRLWERVRSVARNHGLARLWIEDGSSVFWLDQGFEAAGSDMLQKLPPAFTRSGSKRWLTLKLRDESASAVSLEKEFELFRQTQQVNTERLMLQARWLRMLAGLVAATVIVLVGLAIWYVLQRLHRP
jgi:N-acetylglutamate synthase-like GNAT family acetyltransferase